MFWHSNISPEREPYKVLLKRGEFTDPARGGRAVPYKVYYPDGYSDHLPVILWSHGFGGNRDGASFISRFVAAHGYVIVHLTHPGTDSSLWEGKPGHPWDILRKLHVPRQDSLERMRDVPFALDQLQGWADENPDIGAFMDLSNIGMSGHSFGAMTTQAMAGMLLPDSDNKLVSFQEERFKAGILYSPVPVDHLVSKEEARAAYGEIAIPLFHMSGTEDSSPISNFSYQHRLEVYEHSKSEKHLLVLEGGDHMVFNGTRGKLGENPKRARHEEIIKIASLAFWDAMLKNDKDAREWLTGGGFSRYMGGDGQYEWDDE